MSYVLTNDANGALTGLEAVTAQQKIKRTLLGSGSSGSTTTDVTDVTGIVSGLLNFGTFASPVAKAFISKAYVRKLIPSAAEATVMGIYANAVGAGLGLDGGDTQGIDGITGSALRFRVSGEDSTHGFIFENSSGAPLLSIRGSDGRVSIISAIIPAITGVTTINGSALSNYTNEGLNITAGTITGLTTTTINGLAMSNYVNQSVDLSLYAKKSADADLLMNTYKLYAPKIITQSTSSSTDVNAKNALYFENNNTWGVYVGDTLGSGASTASLGGGALVEGAGGPVKKAVRVRVGNTINDGFLVENSNEAWAFAVSGSSLQTTCAGSLQVNGNIFFPVPSGSLTGNATTITDFNVIYTRALVLQYNSGLDQVNFPNNHLRFFSSNTNWGLYYGSSTATDFAVGGMGSKQIVALNGVTDAIRLRVGNASTNGFMVENSASTPVGLFSVTGSSGDLYGLGNASFGSITSRGVLNMSSQNITAISTATASTLMATTIGSNATKVTDLYVTNINGSAYSGGGGGGGSTWVGTATSDLNMANYNITGINALYASSVGVPGSSVANVYATNINGKPYPPFSSESNTTNYNFYMTTSNIAYIPNIILNTGVFGENINQRTGIKFFGNATYGLYFANANATDSATGSLSGQALAPFNSMYEAVRLRLYANYPGYDYRGFIIENSNDNWSAAQTDILYSGLYQLAADTGNSWTKGIGSFYNLTVRSFVNQGFTVKVGADGALYSENVSSSQKQKKNIVPITQQDALDLLKLNVFEAEYTTPCSIEGFQRQKKISCFIAEDIEADSEVSDGFKDKVLVYEKTKDSGAVDDSGKPVYEYELNKVDYQSVIALQNELIKSLHARLLAVEQSLATLLVSTGQ
jgi:hypothetical protein